jgi:hypothetical protein
MTVAQMFAYVRHRYGDMQAYYLKDRDVLAIPLSDVNPEVAASIRELAVRKGLICSTVSAVWPEMLGPEILALDSASDFLVISCNDN